MRSFKKFVTISVKRKSRRSDKWTKTKILMNHSYIKAHIPETRIYNYYTLYEMISEYQMVYIKPKYGSFGRGVTRITQKEGRYLTHIASTITSYASFGSMFQALSSHINGEAYVVQRGIHSLRYQGRLFDFRVVVQRSPSGKFEVTGIAGRISQAGRVVSNAGEGTAIGSIDSLLNRSQCQYVIPRIEKLCLAVMYQVRKRFSGQNEIGIDIALDRNLKPWIIEFNTRPDHNLFLMLRDGQISQIVQYGAKYGRRYKLYNYY